MPAKSKLSTEQKEWMKKNYRTHTVAEMAAQLKISASSVTIYTRAMGLRKTKEEVGAIVSRKCIERSPFTPEERKARRKAQQLAAQARYRATADPEVRRARQREWDRKHRQKKKAAPRPIDPAEQKAKEEATRLRAAQRAEVNRTRKEAAQEVARVKKEEKTRAKAERSWGAHHKTRKKKEASKVKAYRAPDLSRPFRIDHKTTIYLRPGQDPAEVHPRYKKTA